MLAIKFHQLLERFKLANHSV